jgi:hypothetical protein
LELEPYQHDFNSITNSHRERDTEVYGLSTMHQVKGTLEKTSRSYSDVLSDTVINKYRNLDFWNK